MERSALVKWVFIGAAVVFLGLVAGRQQQIVNSQNEILKQIQELKGSPVGRAAQAPQAPAAPAAPAAPPDFNMRIDGSASKGSDKAKLTLIEFSDFECPFCGNYVRDSYPKLEQDYVNTGKIRYVFRNFPLESIHPRALKAGEAGECARVQGKFWQLHDRLFANQKALEPAALLEHAKSVGLDMKAFGSCLEGQATAKLRADLDAGRSAGISGTPTFFLGYSQPDGSVHVVEKLVGARPYASFQATLDKMLAAPAK